MLETRIGAFTVTRVEEMLTPGFDPAFLFPEFDPAIYDEEPLLASAAFRDAATGKTMSSMQSWLVRDGRNTIVIDTGCGNGKLREFPAFRRFHMLDLPYLDRLAKAGVRPGDVSHVINTHLHVDHVGWNTVRLGDGWAPTFPSARYYFGAEELANWLDPATARRAPETMPVIEDSVRPVVEAGLVETVRAGDEILPDLSFEAIPGHTLGQLGVRLKSQGVSALFSADVFHQPMQIVRPSWNSRFCEDQDIARVTRARVLAEEADTGTVIFPSHFGAPHAGTIRRSGAGYRFTPLAAAGA
jgi:glyoxylase-like metal-dependent hydrolase (beta-lactamase superfamily II)